MEMCTCTGTHAHNNDHVWYTLTKLHISVHEYGSKMKISAKNKEKD